MFTKYIVPVVAVIAVAGIGTVVLQNTNKADDGMMKQDAMMKDDPSTMAQDDSMMEQDAMMKKDMYVATAPNLQDGTEKILFFHASWCPSCIKGDSQLQELETAGKIGTTVYKVDYDTSADLKAKYNIAMQHTFVKVDGNGNLLSTVAAPTDTQLMNFIQ